MTFNIYSNGGFSVSYPYSKIKNDGLPDNSFYVNDLCVYHDMLDNEKPSFTAFAYCDNAMTFLATFANRERDTIQWWFRLFNDGKTLEITDSSTGELIAYMPIID